MNIKDVVTYYDLSKLQKKHLQEMCLELDLDSKGLNDELAQRIWNYISANDNRDVLKNYERYLLATRGSVSWYSVNKNLSELRSKLMSFSNNPFEKIQYYNNAEISVEPKVFAATQPEENGNYFLRITLRDGNTSSFSMQGKEIMPRIIQCTVLIDPNNSIIEVRSPAKHTNKIVESLVNLINDEEVEASLIDPLENNNHDLGDFANVLGGNIKESLDIPNQIVSEISDEQIESIAGILKNIDVALQTEDATNLIEEIESAKLVLSKDFPQVSFLSLILAGLGTVRFGTSIEDLRSSPLYDSLYPFLDNQGGYILFEINDHGIETECLIQVGLKSKTINFSKFSSEKVITTVREIILNL